MTVKNDLNAIQHYATLVKMLKDDNWKFNEHPEDFAITAICTGEDIPMQFYIQIVPENETIRFKSVLPFKICEDKRIDAAVAVCVANYGLSIGGFQYDIRDGEIGFVCGTSYTKNEVFSTQFFKEIMLTSLHTVDKYNDRFMMLDKGFMTLQQFIEKDAE